MEAEDFSLLLGVFCLLAATLLVLPKAAPVEVYYATVEGRSMEPTLRDGDVVEWIKTDIRDVRVGDLVVYRHPTLSDHPLVVHRVVEVADGKIRTKGDANAELDRYWVDENCFEGIVVRVVR